MCIFTYISTYFKAKSKSKAKASTEDIWSVYDRPIKNDVDASCLSQISQKPDHFCEQAGQWWLAVLLSSFLPSLLVPVQNSRSSSNLSHPLSNLQPSQPSPPVARSSSSTTGLKNEGLLIERSFFPAHRVAS
ncbi:uncharacterized protein DFL_006277 [Arthrobotrys flagrans]|uniref:Uncharacterized protein n=1 Tax=Arthrobotrys flagrans TaxID=97331 RepID=A0A436ZZV1_ARTFL|nr:hypothetical protein DFL_006277 [Arthrobotrys flagrans]